MLPTEAIYKTNFSDGMIFNPSQIRDNDEFLSLKLARASVMAQTLLFLVTTRELNSLLLHWSSHQTQTVL